MTAPEALLAAGLVEGRVDSLAAAGDDVLREVLGEVLTPATLWTRVGVTRPADAPADDWAHLSRWLQPAAPLSAEDEQRLAAAWLAAVRPPVPAPSNFLRLAVSSLADARALQDLGVVGGRQVVGVLRRHGDRFEWQWPMRIGIAPGPAATQWLDTLQHSPYHGEQYRASLVDPLQPAQFEIVLVPADLVPPRGEPLAEVLHRAGCVVAVGNADPAGTMQTLLEQIEPNIAIVMPVADLSWWMPMFGEMSHDVPIDAAAVMARRDALVAGDDAILSATAVGHWALLAAAESGEPALVDGLETVQFNHEHQASQEICRRAEAARARGAEPAVHAELAQRMAHAEPPETDEAESARRLICELWVDDRPQRKVLPPATDVTLEIKIAVPAAGEIAADAVFKDPQAAGPSAILDVAVRSALWPSTLHQQISLPMDRRDEASTSAAFPLTTGASGTVVEIDIVVSYLQRPLQAATLRAAVRETSLPRERITLLTHGLTSPPEPTESTTPADLMLDGREEGLRNMADDSTLPAIDVARLLAAIEALASHTLGRDDAPDDLDDEDAVALLIDMARKGSELREQLAALHLGADGPHGAIDLLVTPLAPVLPLELVYEGTPPRPGATLCTHHRTTPPPIGESCSHTSARRVCPYAFWGMHRRINRTVVLDARSPRGHTQRLTVSDALYGAALQADHGFDAGQRPSALLAEAAQELVGAHQTLPVTSWRAWRKEVLQRHPSLLLVLAHTQIEHGETSLLLGRSSYLARPDISSKVVRTNDAPAPIVVLMACSSASETDPFGNLPGAFAARGAGAVIATLTKLTGRHGAVATREILRGIVDAGRDEASVGDALLAARRALIGQGVLLGLFLVTHGNVDMKVVR